MDLIVKPDNYKIEVIPSVAEYISALRERNQRMYEWWMSIVILDVVGGHQGQLLLIPYMAFVTLLLVM